MKILITGIGITGKSTFRSILFNCLSNESKAVEQFDCDYDRNKLPKKFISNRVYLLEDVHGPTKMAVFPLDSFDLIFYLLPDQLTHLRFWLSRMRAWFRTGKFAWDADKGINGEWLGNDRPYDQANILPILRTFWDDWKNRKKWIREDLAEIKKMGIKTIIIAPKFKKGRIIFPPRT